MKKQILIAFLLITANEVLGQTPYYPLPKEESRTTATKPGKKQNRDYGNPRNNIFKLNMLSPMYSTMMVFFQHNLKNSNSFQLGFGYMDFNKLPDFITPTGSYSGTSTYPQDENTKAFFITPEYRYMLIGENMDGVFIAPFLKYTKMDYTFSNYVYSGPKTFLANNSFSYQSLGLGVIIGQQWVVRNKISIEVYAGTVYNTLLTKKMSPFPGNYGSKSKWDEIESSQYISTANIRGYGIRAGFTVGFLL